MACQEGWQGEAQEGGGKDQVEGGVDEEPRKAGEDAEEGDGAKEGDRGPGGNGGEVEEARGGCFEHLLDVRRVAGEVAGFCRSYWVV